jgi:hypothetical protein
MEGAKQDALAEHEAELCLEVPEARALLDTFRRAGLSVQRAEPSHTWSQYGRRTWVLFMQPPPTLRERFDLAPEVLLVLAPWPTAQARDITLAESTLGRDHRLDRGVVLHVSKDPRARRELAQAIGYSGRLYVTMTFDEVLEAPDPQVWLRQLLGDHIARADLFASGRPVFGWDFVGREKELRALRGRLLDGRPVGLFGLRKVGKTSLLLSLRDQWLRDAAGDEAVVHAVPIHVDLLAVSFEEPNLDGILRLVLVATTRVVTELGIELRLHPPSSSKGLPLHGQALRERVAHTLRLLLDWCRIQPSRPPVVLLIDEYERLYGAARMPVDDGLDFLDFLRGLVQQYPQEFNFLVAGLRREPAARSRYGERQNPLFGFLVDSYLAGLDRTETGELVRKIGRRLGLHFDAGAVDEIWTETGGHPFLVRELGRTIDSAIPASERQVAARTVDAASVLAFREDFRRTVGNTMQEIAAAVAELDADGLDALARPDFQGLAVQTAGLLQHYGILAPSTGHHPFRIAAFHAWLALNHLGSPMVAHG